LYSAVYRRRVAFSVTSVSGLPAFNDITFAMGHARLRPAGLHTDLEGATFSLTLAQRELAAHPGARTRDCAARHSR
jgi:hypothetical protein